MCLRVCACLSTLFTLHRKTSLRFFTTLHCKRARPEDKWIQDYAMLMLLCHTPDFLKLYHTANPLLPCHIRTHQTTLPVASPVFGYILYLLYIIYTYIIQIDTCILFSSTSLHNLHLPQTSETNKKWGQTRHVGLRPLENASNAQGDLAGKTAGWRSFSGKNSIGS